MPDRTPLPSSPDEDDAYFRAVLIDLVDRGQALARAIQERALAATTTGADPDPTVAFDRVARAIRRCIALARHIRANPVTEAAPANTEAARTTLIRGVEDAIHRRVRNPRGADIDADQLSREFTEILEDPATEFDLQGRPVHEVVEEICRDLGINAEGRSYVFKRRTPEDRRALRARAVPPSGPASRTATGPGHQADPSPRSPRPSAPDDP